MGLFWIVVTIAYVGFVILDWQETKMKIKQNKIFDSIQKGE